jgi:hypothetical protein
MTDRGPNGQFIKGNKASPGRKPAATEAEYRGAVKEVIPLDRFIRQLEKLASRADRGDSRAFDKICDLLGLNIIKNEFKFTEPIEITGVDYRTAITNLAPGSMGNSETPGENQDPVDGPKVG